jgi:hypothetical protein
VDAWTTDDVALLLIYLQHIDQFAQMILFWCAGLTGWAVLGIFFRGSKWLGSSARGISSGPS